jgi:hypothetical protein
VTNKFRGHTYIATVVDRSWSMQSLTPETISGYNNWLRKQKAEPRPDKASLMLTLFNTNYETAGMRPLAEAVELNAQTYVADGNTALLDAVGKTLDLVEPMVSERDRVLFVIITDGEENSSQVYKGAEGGERIAARIKECEGRGNWTFVYLGANQDAWQVASSSGYTSSPQNTMTWNATPAGTSESYATLNAATSQYRARAGGQSVSFFSPEPDPPTPGVTPRYAPPKPKTIRKSTKKTPSESK